MKKLVLISFLFLASQSLFSQLFYDNFETPNVKDWTEYNTIDYFFDETNNYVGHQKAYSGKGYLGVVFANNAAYKELISFELKEPLQKDTTYYLEFFLSLADREKEFGEELNVCFSAIKPHMQTKKVKGKLTFQVQCDSLDRINLYISKVNKKEWTKISYLYKAKGNENHVTLGNMVNQITKRFTQQKGVKSYEAFYYLDKIIFRYHQQHKDSVGDKK